MVCQENVNQEYDTNLYEGDTIEMFPCGYCGELMEDGGDCATCQEDGQEDGYGESQEDVDELYNSDYCNGSESDSDDTYANW